MAKKIFFILIILLLPITVFAQEEEITVTDSLTAWASNYYPKINEPVTLTLKLKAQYNNEANYGQPSLKLGFSVGGYLDSKTNDYILKEGIEIVSSTPFYEGSIKKGNIIEHSITVRFTKKNVYDLSAFYGRNLWKQMYIYVDGAKIDDPLIQNIKEEIEILKKQLVPEEKNNSLSNKNEKTDSQNIIFGQINKESKLRPGLKKSLNKEEILKRLDPENSKLYIKLESELDSLKKEAEKLLIKELHPSDIKGH